MRDEIHGQMLLVYPLWDENCARWRIWMGYKWISRGWIVIVLDGRKEIFARLGNEAGHLVEVF